MLFSYNYYINNTPCPQAVISKKRHNKYIFIPLIFNMPVLFICPAYGRKRHKYSLQIKPVCDTIRNVPKGTIRRSTQAGRRGSPGKGVGREKRRAGSNPAFSAENGKCHTCISPFLYMGCESPHFKRRRTGRVWRQVWAGIAKSLLCFLLWSDGN